MGHSFRPAALGLQRAHDEAPGCPVHLQRDYSGLFTRSPVFAGVDPLNVPTDEVSSTSVIVTVPMGLSMRRRTLPVAGSVMTRPVWRTSNLSPTFTPLFLPTFRTS